MNLESMMSSLSLFYQAVHMLSYYDRQLSDVCASFSLNNILPNQMVKPDQILQGYSCMKLCCSRNPVSFRILDAIATRTWHFESLSKNQRAPTFQIDV